MNEIPGCLSERVGDDRGILRVRTPLPVGAVVHMAFDLLALVALVISVGTCGLGAPLLLLVPMAAILGIPLGLARSPWRWTTITRDGIALPGEALAHRPNGLTVTGNPGQTMVLRADDQILLSVEANPEGPWTPDALTWFVEAAADRLEVPWIDGRPKAEWQRWMAEPLYRARCRWDRATEANRTAYASRWNTGPVAPPTRQWDHHSIEFTIGAATRVELTEHEVCLGGRMRIPFAQIDRARPLFGEESVFEVLEIGGAVQRAGVALGHPNARGWGEMHWLATEIERRAQLARALEPGSAQQESVPKALLALRGRTQED